MNTVCLVSLKKNYENADAKCQSQGMFLYNVDVPEVEKALLDFSNSLFRPSLGEALFVDGKRSEGCAAVANKEGLFALSFIDCSEKHYFYCQFTRTPKTEKLGDHETMKEKTTITIIILSFFDLLGPLNTIICQEKQDLFDKNNNYLQSACLVTEERTYSRSEAYCRLNGMDLIDISSEESKTALLEYATDFFAGSVDVFFLVKGRDFEQCQHIHSADGTFEALYGNCYDDSYSFCAHNKSNPNEISSNFERKFTWNLQQWLSVTLIGHLHMHFLQSVVQKKKE
jgi:hypothetical protein